MTSCPRCEGPLALQASGAFRDEHGVFLPASTMRQPASYAVAAALRGALANAPPDARRCPSCRAPLHALRLAGEPPLALGGCGECHGFWVEAADLDALRRAQLARKASAPRRVGGYGGNAVVRDPAGALGEGLFALLERLKAFPP